MTTLTEIQDKVIQAANREITENHEIRISPPVGMIDSFFCENGGYEIHCENGYNFCLGSDGYLYDVGYDA